MPGRKSQKRAEADKRIEKALNELTSGQFQSVRGAAKANDVPHSTLLKRLNGGKSVAQSREPQQILTIPEENALAECITHFATVGHPPKHSFIRELAEEIRASRNRGSIIHSPNQPSIGDSWVQRFIHRHPKLETAFSRAIEVARIKDITREDLDCWFDEFEKTIGEKNIRVEDMYNMDETGFAIGTVQNSYVVIKKDSKMRYQAQPGRQEWASVVECVCADGGSTPPFVILKGLKVMSSWIPAMALDLNWHFAASKKGWTSNDLGFEWLVRVFDPVTQQKLGKEKDRTRLLICDGHDSHISAKFVAHCIENNICLFLLLPHSSHILQPLDVGVFGPLKTVVSADLDRLIRVGVIRLEKAEWVESYIRARPNGLTETNIRAGWRHSGLVPTNRHKHHHVPSVINSSPTSQSVTPGSPTFEDALRNSAKVDTAGLDFLNLKLSELAIRNEINTPIRREMPKLLSRNRQLFVENIILKRRLGDVERIVCERKERKHGKRNLLKGKTVVSTLEVLEELKKCEIRTNLNKCKRGPRERKNQATVSQEIESTSEDDNDEEEIDELDVIEVGRLR
jgi:DDE superfamily endonuclease/Tc5 transposase DNA-binding domain/helix-turn-helix, Psq domain